MWGTLPDWLAAVGGVVTATTAIVLAVGLRARERTQALTELHLSLTTGETAAARETLGTLMYSRKYRHTVGELEAIAAYFKLIWAVHHSWNVFNHYHLDWSRRFGEPGPPKGGPRQTRAIASALTWNLREIEENLERFHATYSEKWEIEDSDAWGELVRITDKRQRKG